MADLWAFSKGMTIYCLALAALLGAVLASFSGCVAARLRTGESFLRGRSHCDGCGHVLAAGDLVPVFSWLLRKGRCRYCGAQIPAGCPMTEALEGLTFAVLLWHYGLTAAGGQAIILAALLFLISLIDWETGIIPDSLVLAVCADFAVFTAVSAGWRAVGMGALGGLMLGGGMLVLALMMDRVLGRESMGGGDIKLFFAVGLFFPWSQLLLLLIFSCVIGIVVNLLTAKTTEDPDNPKAFPFGPAIAAGTILTLLWGTPILNWYLGLFL